MGLWKTSKKIAGHIVDVRVDRWFGLNFLKKTGQGIYHSASDLIRPEKTDRVETFEQAMIRLNLTEADLKKQLKQFSRLLIFFMMLALVIFGYSVYIALHDNLLGFLIGVALTIFTLSQAFRYHFWIFQIKHRKLGCSLQDWLNSKPNTTDSTLPKKKPPDEL